MSWFGKDTVEAVGGAVTGTIESINYALSGDLPPDVRVKLEEVKLKMQEVDLKINQGQVELNKEEAKSSNLFKSGWRPAIGWIGVLGLFYHFIGYNTLVWYLAIIKSDVTAPILNTEGLFPLVLGMLGIGGFRTYEKFKGIAK